MSVNKHILKFNENLKEDSKNALIICNNIITQLALAPNNLPNDRDIPYRLRKEYNLLLDSKYYRNERLNKANMLYNVD